MLTREKLEGGVASGQKTSLNEVVRKQGREGPQEGCGVLSMCGVTEWGVCSLGFGGRQNGRTKRAKAYGRLQVSEVGKRRVLAGRCALRAC